MSEIPPWMGATVNYGGNAGLVNQFRASHNTTMLWAATTVDQNITNGATTTGTNGLYLAQSFTTGSSQTALGYLNQPISTTTTTGANLAPTTISIYPDSNGTPDTTQLLAQTVITAEYAYSTSGITSSNTSTVYPVPCAVTPNNKYWMVLAATASTGQFTGFRSASASGALTSPDGVTWTAQAYGFRYRQTDQTTSGRITCTYEDNGARWTSYLYNANGTISTYSEYTDCQGPVSSYVQSCRTFNYSQGMLTSVT